jgi:hypothetical protein
MYREGKAVMRIEDFLDEPDTIMTLLVSHGDDVKFKSPELKPIPGGFRVKETGTHYIDVLRMLYNWRITITPKEGSASFRLRSWCYAGTDVYAFTAAVVAVVMWDGAADTEPVGWNKNVQTGEWREPSP